MRYQNPITADVQGLSAGRAAPPDCRVRLSHGVKERDSNNVPVVSYTRGIDLAGPLSGGDRGGLEGAGGVGGLLARSHGYLSGTGNWTNHNFYHADGNGNVTFMLNSSQSMVARYHYDPFGDTTSASGSLAAANPYRFLTKCYGLNCHRTLSGTDVVAG